MKRFLHAFTVLCAALALPAGAAPVATTAGSNLTAYNPQFGANNNNQWNSMTNSRVIAAGANGGNNTAKVDFGNCNAVILRCASPKCGAGGCSDAGVAAAIVSGCVASNDTCSKYGPDLVEFLTAQLVASSTAAANNAAANVAAANAVAEQSQQQLQQMQMQMQQIQSQMVAQNQQLQDALTAQQTATAQAIADAAAAASASQNTIHTPSGDMPVVPSPSGANEGITYAQAVAAQNGMSADVLLREQLSGEIMQMVENAEKSLNSMKTRMQEAFRYAGCDEVTGEGCRGPKRVSIFKKKAREVFNPYNDVLDQLLAALETAQAVGIDISDVYMMLAGECSRWSKYICTDGTLGTYNIENCPNGRSIRSAMDITCARYDPNDSTKCLKYGGGYTRGGNTCLIGQAIPPQDSPLCQATGILSDGEVVNTWISGDDNGDYAYERVGCASSVLESNPFFKGRKKQAKIDMETLERILNQDAPTSIRKEDFSNGSKDPRRMCAAGGDRYDDLRKYVSTKTLPTQRLCVRDRSLIFDEANKVALIGDEPDRSQPVIGASNKTQCIGHDGVWDINDSKCYCPMGMQYISEAGYCIAIPANTGYVYKETRAACPTGTIDYVHEVCICPNGMHPNNDETNCEK